MQVKLILAAGVSLMVCFATIAVWLDRPASRKAAADSAGSVVDASRPQATTDATAGAIYSARFTDLEGREHILGEWQHKLVLINFWATWCAPCKEEMPMLAKLQENYASHGLKVIGIAADSRLNVANFAKLLPNSYLLIPEEAGAIEFSRRLGNRLGLLPFTIVIKPGGEVIFTRLGRVTEAEMIELIDKNIQK